MSIWFGDETGIEGDPRTGKAWFINEFAIQTKKSKKKVVLILDNASWHKAAKLNWHHVTPVLLPPYSPHLNPIERLWLVIKNRYFKNWHTRDPDKLTKRICEAIQDLLLKPHEVMSICKINF